ncbi:MAG: tRNA (guanine(10)-N2)-dimethyltransferase [Methanoregulaceae archaeon PtaB.Bin152]|nr:MAG: tRNA (guanine(10)-N2)-dimethyltransferase [Methanoregulaceae archaeon PtaB.Bin152]
MHLLVELAGDHPHLPFAELDLLGTLVERGTQVAVIDCKRQEEVSRLALAHSAMEFLGSCPGRREAFERMLKDLSLTSSRPFAGRAKKVHGNTMDATQAELERLIGSLVQGKVDLQNPQEEFRVIVSGSRCYLGRVLWRSDPRRFAGRRPGDRPFFHPGVMMPRMVRALLNISCVRRNETILDPFCGTGGMIMEALLLGISGVGSDIDPKMVLGSRMNARDAAVLLADGRELPFRDESFDAVVTDLPYGQSVAIRARSLDSLYHAALGEITRVLRPGRRAVLVTHRDIRPLADTYMTVEGCYSQRVHKSLTRHILVLAKEVKGG